MNSLLTMGTSGTPVPHRGFRVEMSLLGLCNTCNAEPKGIDGHAELHAESQPLEQGKGRFQFRCMACGARWSRRYAGSGEFAWELERLDEGPARPPGGVGTGQRR
jgi:hypothetical protein